MKKKKEKDNTIDLVSVSLGITVILGLLLFVFISMSLYTSDEIVEKTWKVYLSRASNVSCSKTAICTNPTVYNNSTSIGDYTFQISSVSDRAKYELNVINDGKVDAELVSIVMSTPKCASNSIDSQYASDIANLVCSNIQYKLVDEDENTIGLGDLVRAGEQRKYYLLIKNDLELTDTAILGTIIISNLSVSLNYAQA